MSHKDSANSPEIFTGRPEAAGYPAFERAASLVDVDGPIPLPGAKPK